MNKIAVIGNFGGGKNLVDGQVIKTQILVRELSRCTNWDIAKVDTNDLRISRVHFIYRLLRTLLTTKSAIVIVSTNGRKFLFPMLWFFSRFLKKNIYHVVIGGVLAQEAEKSRIYRMYLNSFRNNFVETKLLARELQKSGVKNTKILPNFRSDRPLTEKELRFCSAEPYTFCTFSCVTKEKGIEDAVTAIRNVNERNGRTVCQLRIYGPVDNAYKERFDALMKDSGPDICYEGTVSHDRAIQTLSQFYATLFPTYWPSESNAGTISDSLSAGVPVLATDWRCNKEMIRDGYNGVIYPGKSAITLEEAIQWAIDHRSEMPQIKRNCLKSAEYYQADMYMPGFIHLLEENEKKKRRRYKR